MAEKYVSNRVSKDVIGKNVTSDLQFLLRSTDYNTLYRSVARSRTWVESSIRLLLEKTNRLRIRDKIDSDALEEIFAAYYLEIFTGEEVDPAYGRLLTRLQKTNKLTRHDITEILGLLAQREVSQQIYKPVPKDSQRRDGAFIRLGLLTLYAPAEDVSLETILRYELVRRAWKLDWSLCSGNGTIVGGIPTLLGTGKYYSLYADPETLGIFKSKRTLKKVSTLLSSSLLYNERIIQNMLLEKDVRFFTQDRVLAERLQKRNLTVVAVNNQSLFIIGNADPGELTQELKDSLLPLPQVPLDFDSMFARLVAIANYPPVRWARFSKPRNKKDIFTPDLPLGLVSRSYPKDYYEADSISDVFSHLQRMSCHTTSRKTGREKRSQVELWNENRIFYHHFMEKNHLSSNEDLFEYFYTHTGACGIFNAGLAVYVYKRFGGSGSRVLDGFAGWTERMIAAAAADCSEYRGFDTNEQIPYETALTALREKKGSLIDNYSVEIKAFEQTKLPDNHFDIALLSPPFFRYEIYKGAATSTALYKELDDWIDSFWIPCLLKTLDAMRVGGWILLYMPAGKDETAVAMLEAVERSYKERTFNQGRLGFVTTAEGSNKIRHLFVYRKRPVVILNNVEALWQLYYDNKEWSELLEEASVHNFLSYVVMNKLNQDAFYDLIDKSDKRVLMDIILQKANKAHFVSYVQDLVDEDFRSFLQQGYKKTPQRFEKILLWLASVFTPQEVIQRYIAQIDRLTAEDEDVLKKMFDYYKLKKEDLNYKDTAIADWKYTD